MKRFLLALFALTLVAQAADKKIVLLAGARSHRPGDHEFRAGCILLNKWLNAVKSVKAEMHTNGWPKSNDAFKDADAVFIFADGGGRHPAIRPERTKLLNDLVKQGVGIGCAHYGVEVPKGDTGKTMQDWIGGYYEHRFSVNPLWSPDYQKLPKHPVTSGVKPFKVFDEWYFNMRFRTDKIGKITPILAAKPGKDVRDGPYVFPKGPYPHIIDGLGRPEVMMWAYDRPDGGRGFGFTGGHKHINWGNENFRKVVLNALLWIAKAEIPKNGVASKVTEAELKANWDR